MPIRRGVRVSTGSRTQRGRRLWRRFAQRRHTHHAKVVLPLAVDAGFVRGEHRKQLSEPVVCGPAERSVVFAVGGSRVGPVLEEVGCARGVA